MKKIQKKKSLFFLWILFCGSAVGGRGGGWILLSGKIIIFNVTKPRIPRNTVHKPTTPRSKEQQRASFILLELFFHFSPSILGYHDNILFKKIIQIFSIFINLSHYFGMIKLIALFATIALASAATKFMVTDVFIPSDCESIAKSGDHLLIEYAVVFQNGTEGSVLREPSQLVHILLSDKTVGTRKGYYYFQLYVNQQEFISHVYRL